MRRHRMDLAAITFIVLLALVAVFALHREMAATGIAMLAAVVYLANYDAIRGGRRHTQYYVLFVWGDVEPQLFGPYETVAQRDEKSHELRRKEGTDGGGLYMLNVSVSGGVEVGTYTGTFFDEDAAVDENKSVQVSNLFLNHYRCPTCGNEWADTWSAMVDDDCPQCGTRHISPRKSEDCPVRISSG